MKKRAEKKARAQARNKTPLHLRKAGVDTSEGDSSTPTLTSAQILAQIKDVSAATTLPPSLGTLFEKTVAMLQVPTPSNHTPTDPSPLTPSTPQTHLPEFLRLALESWRANEEGIRSELGRQAVDALCTMFEEPGCRGEGGTQQ